jgi:hypothetical protein
MALDPFLGGIAAGERGYRDQQEGHAERSAGKTHLLLHHQRDKAVGEQPAARAPD